MSSLFSVRVGETVALPSRSPTPVVSGYNLSFPTNNTSEKEKNSAKRGTRKNSAPKKYIIKKEDTQISVFINPRYEPEEDILLVIESVPDIKLYNASQGAYSKSEYKHVVDHIHGTAVRAGTFCQGLSLSYLASSFAEANAVIVLGSKNMNVLPNGNIFAFASLKMDADDNSLYIDVICSNKGIKYAGDILMKSIFEFAKTLYITKIKLKSVNDAISFYEKYGFKKVRACPDKKELCEMKKTLYKGGSRVARAYSRKNGNQRAKTRKIRA